MRTKKTRKCESRIRHRTLLRLFKLQTCPLAAAPLCLSPSHHLNKLQMHEFRVMPMKVPILDVLILISAFKIAILSLLTKTILLRH